ncbi:MAG: folate-binding protein YgfZ [Bryobacteraceae bacterium]
MASALRESAAWLDLGDRGRIFVTGRDRVRLLHNITTNHVKQLTAGRGCYAFILTPQGRIQADLNLLALEDRFLVDVEPEARERVPELIRKYIIADDVKLEDAGEALTTIAVEGPRAGEALAAAGAPAPEAVYAHAAWGDARVARISATGQPGFRIFVPSAEKDGLIARLALPAASREEAGALRIENGVPRFPDDLAEALPQETRQLHGVHFQKGCYLGQEIVERIRARGHVNRELVRLVVEGAAAPGSKLVAADGQEAGLITSAAYSRALGKTVALGYARVGTGPQYKVNGQAAVAA